ncbi:MAG: HAD-IA family hydrolase [Parabacteroides sp.]|nr:HAD-IA family hydrolase [Parabacteroides sp.]MDY6004239.1 HAD-IA family hydrolase [Parabacteroides sp.]
MMNEAIKKYVRARGVKALQPKAVLFDMDGVLYDSMPHHAAAWTEVAHRHGLIGDPELFYLFEGRTGASTIQELYRRTYGREATEEEVQTIYDEKAALFNTLNCGAVMPGAADVLAAVKRLGLQIVVVTGSGQRTLIDKLNHNYPGYFDREKMVTSFDVKYGKPHPEPYLMGLQKAGVQAHEALVVENAPLGVQAAVAAGIFTIAVNTGPLPDQVLWDAGTNLLFHSMQELAHLFIDSSFWACCN